MADKEAKPPADEQGLAKAIEGCEDFLTLKRLTQQYCRDRWKALKEKSAALLEEARLSELYAKAILDLKSVRKGREKYRVSLFKAVNERNTKQVRLDAVALDRRNITLQLGDTVIELSRLQQRFNYVNTHRIHLIAAVMCARICLEKAGTNPDLQARLLVVAKNYGLEPEDKPEGKQNEPS